MVRLSSKVASLGLGGGSIVIDTQARRLYFIVSANEAIQYKVAVPQKSDDKDWYGYTQVVDKRWMPDWAPPASVKAAHPELPDLIPGGSPHNPMGPAAILLSQDQVAIHGTTAKMRTSVLKGQAASFGCIRMLSEDVADLFQRVGVGAVVLKM
ncbi:MAG: L,D-transpeptidase [Bdellovibrionaceae bacterium]|nr:L,D-transpeptidase [Pseudobdellovibrionaceae bacterium]